VKKAAQRSMTIDGRKTSVSVESAFWSELKEIAHVQCVTLSSLIGAIDATRKQGNLSSAIRIFVLEHLQNKVAHNGSASSRKSASL